MLLLIHISSALASLIYTTLVYIRPSKLKFYTSYSLIGLTLASGTYLVVSTGASILGSCITGLVYLAVVSFGMAGARKKFALENAKSD